MGLVQEFKKFAIKGNAIDMAVGIIIGGAFGKIISSLVNDVILPPIGLLLGGTDFSSLFIPLDGASHASLEAAREAGAPVLAYGSFTQSVVDFVIVTLVIFFMVRGMNSLRAKEEEKPAAPAPPSDEVKLLTEIRDALRDPARSA
jgi:large conductance mechanosensitive channel